MIYFINASLRRMINHLNPLLPPEMTACCLEGNRSVKVEAVGTPGDLVAVGLLNGFKTQ
jgi:hypothetical protein